MSSPATQTQSLKIKLNFGSPTSRVLARSHSYSNRSLNSSNLNSQPTPPSAASSGTLKNLLDSPIARKPGLSSKNSSEGEISSTPLSNSVSAEGSTASENNSNVSPNTQDIELQAKPSRVIRNRLLKVPKRAIPLSISKSPSQNSISSSSQISSSSRGIVKKLYLPKRKFRGTRRSVLKTNNTENTDINLDSIRLPRTSHLKTQPVFGIRGYQSFKNKVGKKSRRKGPQPLFKRVLLKNANFATYERMKLIKNIKPREWKLERISNLSDNSSNIGVSTWKPTSSRRIKPIILPSAIPISRPPRQLYHNQHQHQHQHQRHQVSQSSLATCSKNIQPHTIPAPINVNKTVTANRGAIPVLSFIDENGNKRLQCPGKDCPKHFADRCGLNRHKKKYHPELEPLGSSSTSQLHS